MLFVAPIIDAPVTSSLTRYRWQTCAVYAKSPSKSHVFIVAVFNCKTWRSERQRRTSHLSTYGDSCGKRLEEVFRINGRSPVPSRRNDSPNIVVIKTWSIYISAAWTLLASSEEQPSICNACRRGATARIKHRDKFVNVIAPLHMYCSGGGWVSSYLPPPGDELIT